MPRAQLAKAARTWFEEQDLSGLVVERSAGSKTGYVNVKCIKGKYFQAQLHVSKKGREDGGQKPLPGLWRTALEAAQFRALMIREGCPEPTPAPGKRRMTALEGEPAMRLAMPVAHRLTCACHALAFRSGRERPEHHRAQAADERAPPPALRAACPCSGHGAAA